MTERPAGSLRRTRALPAAAAGVAGEEVGRGRGGARLPRHRGRDRRQRAERRRFRLALPRGRGGSTALLFYLRLPLRLRREIRSFRPEAIFASDPFLGAAALAGRALARRRVPVIVEVHGDWRTFSRLYGSPARRLISPLADAVAAYGGPARRRDAGRLELHRRPRRDRRGRAAERRLHGVQRPLGIRRAPAGAAARATDGAFVGALEAYKNVEGLAAAWRIVAERVPAAAARDRRQRLAAGGRRRSSWRTSPAGSSTTSGSSPRPSPSSSTPRRCSCCLLAGGPRPRDHRVVRPGPRGGRDGRRRHPRSRHGRGRRAARAAGGLGGARGRARAGARATGSSPRGWGRRRGGVTGTGTRLPRSSPVTCGRSSRPRSPERRADVRLVFVTQTVDADHPVLAQTVDLVRALAARCESVTVICDSVAGTTCRQRRVPDVRRAHAARPWRSVPARAPRLAAAAADTT